MIRVGVGFVSNMSWNASSDSNKRCWTGLNQNTDYYLEIHKTIAVPGQLLAGQGVVSYTQDRPGRNWPTATRASSSPG